MSNIIEDAKLLKEREVTAASYKEAQAEVLLANIAINSEAAATVYPSNCPGKGRKPDVQIDSGGSPVCINRGSKCPYFGGAEFALKDYTKKIDCMVE